MAKSSNEFNISGSSGVSIGSVSQSILPEKEKAEESPAIRVLFLGANPDDTARLRLDREIQAIERALRASGLNDRFKLEQSWAVGPAEIQDALLRYRPHIVHFSGHGEEGGSLVLEPDHDPRNATAPGGAPEPHLASRSFVDSLAELFAIAKGNIRCVVLNACHSEAQAKAIAAHIDCAIGMSGSIEDSSAIGFSWAFYHALGQGESVQKAFSLARVQAQLASPDGSDGGPEIFSTHTDLEALRF